MLMNPRRFPIHFPPVPKGTAPLWFGVLGAPAAWGLQLQSVYAMAHTACIHDRRSLLNVVTAVLLAAAVVFTVVSVIYRTSEERFPEQRNGNGPGGAFPEDLLN